MYNFPLQSRFLVAMAPLCTGMCRCKCASTALRRVAVFQGPDADVGGGAECEAAAGSRCNWRASQVAMSAPEASHPGAVGNSKQHVPAGALSQPFMPVKNTYVCIYSPCTCSMCFEFEMQAYCLQQLGHPMHHVSTVAHSVNLHAARGLFQQALSALPYGERTICILDCRGECD